MLWLKYLEVQGFRSFKEKTRVEFPKTGLVLIRGPSGVGKTNLLLAISYALDICPIPATKLKSWFSNKFQIELGLESAEGPIIIRRGSENSVTRNGNTITGAKAVTEEIPKIVGMSNDILSSVTYRVQRKPGAFVSKGDTEKREFLGALIPLLDQIERAVEQSENELKNLNKTIEPLVIKREGLVEATEKLRLNIVQDPIIEQWPVKKLELKEKIDAIVARFAENDSSRKHIELQSKQALTVIDTNPELIKRRDYVAFVKQLLQNETETEKARRAEFDKGQKVLHGQISNLEQGLWSAKRELAQEVGLRQQLSVLEGNICPTCSQTWVKNQEAKTKVLESLEKLEKIKLNVPAIEAVIKKMKEGLKGWEENPKIQELSKDILTKEGEINLEVSRLRSEILFAFKDLKQKLELESQSIVSDQRRFADELAQTERRYHDAMMSQDRFHKMIAENETSIAKIDQDLEKLKRSVLMEENVIRCLGKNGFLGSIFDQILVEIETEINKMLVGMTNAQNISIKFKTETVTGKGIAKKTITPVVYIGGFETDLDSGPSGGQQSSIELVIDLAVLRVVERRTGRVPGWLLQDEVIIGQGSDTSVNAIEILKEFAEDKMVLVIDHSSEVKEYFQKVIDVRMENGVSYIS